MAAKRTRGKATKKKGGRPKSAPKASRKRKAVATKKPRAAAAKKKAAPKLATAKPEATTGLMNLLRAWSPTRYSR